MMIMVPQASTYYYVPQAAPAAPSNFFLPAAPSYAAQPMAVPMAPQPYAAQPMAMPMALAQPMAMPMAPQPSAAQPMVAVPVAAVPAAAVPAGGVSMTNQTIQVPTSRSSTRVRVRGPGLLSSSLARFGERLTRLGRTRIETIQETELEAPIAQQPPGAVTTISTASAAPIVAAPTAPVAPQAPTQAVPEAPTPSPQGAPPKHSLLRHLLGHD